MEAVVAYHDLDDSIFALEFSIFSDVEPLDLFAVLLPSRALNPWSHGLQSTFHC